MRKPVTIVTGIHPESMSAAVLSMAWDVPDAVVLRHRIDLERCVLERLVSDVTGIVEHESIDLEHACVPCAIREDVVPTLQRLARDPRWGAVIAELPVSAEANQVCHVLTQDRDLRRSLRVTSVVAAVDGGLVEDDLLGDELLPERDIATSHEDRRGVGEVCADIVEFADVVVVTGRPEPVGIALVEALARPGVLVVVGSEQLEAEVISTPLHEIGRTRAWANPARTAVLPELGSTRVWRVDLRSDRAFHPARLLGGLAQLGGGRHRSRGCFWFADPSRPRAGLGRRRRAGEHRHRGSLGPAPAPHPDRAHRDRHGARAPAGRLRGDAAEVRRDVRTFGRRGRLRAVARAHPGGCLSGAPADLA